MEELRQELEAIHAADQAVREEAMAIVREHGTDSAQYVELRDRARAQDRRHTERLLEIVEQHGWPRRSVVGELAARGAFFVVQHSGLDTQRRMLPELRDAVAEGEAEPSSLAMLEDRVRMLSGEPQLYGSQVARHPDGSRTIWPIEHEDGLDERRARMGLEPFDAYLARFGLTRESPRTPRSEDEQ